MKKYKQDVFVQHEFIWRFTYLMRAAEKHAKNIKDKNSETSRFTFYVLTSVLAFLINIVVGIPGAHDLCVTRVCAQNIGVFLNTKSVCP